MNVLIDQFLDHISLERGLSENTRVAYSSDLRSFSAYLKKCGVSSLNSVKREQILDYLMKEKERGLSVNSISRRLVAIKIFFSYLQQEGLLDRNITEVMDSPQLWKVLPDLLSLKEVERLINATIGEHPRALRDKAIVEMLYATGMRVSELINLKIENLHFDSGYLRCTGKGNKVRVIPFGGKSRECLEKYLSDARSQLAKDKLSPNVFLTYRGTKFNSRKGVWEIIKRYARLAGITKNVSPHTLRHSFASHMLANGAPLRVIQELLGHADITTTQVYTHVDHGRLRSAHAQYHPRA